MALGDNSHKKLLQNGWTWYPASFDYQKIYWYERGGHGRAVLHLRLQGQDPGADYTMELRIRHARENSWDFYLMGPDTEWIRICVHDSFFGASKAVLGRIS